MTACENQGKPHKLSDHWKSNVFFIKITGDDAQKTKRWTEIEVLTKVTQLFKPINYWEIVDNTRPN